MNERLAAIINRFSEIRFLFFLLALLVTWSCRHDKVAVSVPSPVPVAAKSAEPLPIETPKVEPLPVESVKIDSAPQAITPRSVVPSQPEPPKPVPSEAEPPLKTKAEPSKFDLAETSFQAGNYAQAAKYYEEFLRVSPKDQNRDRALFYLGLSRALLSDAGSAEAAFKRLISEFPKSQYKNPAQYILGLQSQIDKLKSEAKDREDKVKRLSDELQKLKDIDMQRRPSRTE